MNFVHPETQSTGPSGIMTCPRCLVNFCSNMASQLRDPNSCLDLILFATMLYSKICANYNSIIGACDKLWNILMTQKCKNFVSILHFYWNVFPRLLKRVHRNFSSSNSPQTSPSTPSATTSSDPQHHPRSTDPAHH